MNTTSVALGTHFEEYIQASTCVKKLAEIISKTKKNRNFILGDYSGDCL